MANGMLTEDQVESLKWSAADCNHDGEVNGSDVLLLEQAGLLLSSVDQTLTGDRLQQDSALIDYVELIDQSSESFRSQDEPYEQDAPAFIQRIIEFI